MRGYLLFLEDPFAKLNKTLAIAGPKHGLEWGWGRTWVVVAQGHFSKPMKSLPKPNSTKTSYRVYKAFCKRFIGATVS